MSEFLIAKVREKYADVARSSLSSDNAGVRAVAEAFGYSPEELAALPAEANMGLSCGNPTAMAGLKPGEVVVDLGCGGGIDVLLAASKVGPTGKAIGIDMTHEMLDRARANAERAGATNVEFHLAKMEAMPLADHSVDCIISNCVINLAADKSQVFREMIRILKPGGRLAVSDIALKQPIPEALAHSVAAYVGCIAGALPIADYVSQLQAAGFDSVQVVDSKKDLNAYAKIEAQSSCCGGGDKNPTLLDDMAELLRKHNVNDYAASVRVFALRPVGFEPAVRSAEAAGAAPGRSTSLKMVEVEPSIPAPKGCCS